MVIQARPAQAPIIELEAQGGDEVERRPGDGAKPDHVPRVRGDFRLIENDRRRRHGGVRRSTLAF